MSGQIAAVDMFMFCPGRFTVLIRLSFLLAGCAQPPQSCPSNTPIGIIAADNIAADDSLPFRLPLDESSSDGPHFFTLGELIAYLGDADENGGSVQHPLEPHLHFGVRAGQRADYPGRGDWRWQAGWIKSCPQDLGWLQSSAVISSQDIPSGGFPEPAPGFLVLWGGELLLTALYTLFGIGMLFFAIRKNKPFFMVFPGAILITAGIVFYNNRMVGTYTLLAIGILISVFGLCWFNRRSFSKHAGDHL